MKFRYTNRVACHFSVTNWSTTGCTIIHETSIPRCSEIMILNHMDASIQKCCDLKRSCTPASQGSHQKPNKFQNSNGQFFFQVTVFLPGRSWERKQTIFYFWPNKIFDIDILNLETGCNKIRADLN